MPLKLINWSIQNRLLVIIASLILLVWGWNAARNIPLDAIPDLSDVQIIIKTSYPGQAPQVVEDQVTYPITTTMLSVAGATTVRGYSFFGDSYVYVIFEDGVDPYWARSRVLEYLNQVSKELPEGVEPHLGPDATGVGWIYSYALVDRTGQYDLSELRSLQDWFIRHELQTVPGVAEIASVGGMVRQYQIIVDPEKLRAYEIPVSQVIKAVRAGNQEVGGSVIELGEAEYVIRTRGYLSSLEDIREIPLDVTEDDIPILLGDIAHIQVGPEMRRAIAELDGEGEVAGGIVVMRYGSNALETIAAVKQRIEVLKQGLPQGVEIVETYDRSTLIQRAVSNLSEKLVEEFIVVALVCVLFLFHLRSAIVAIVTLPLGIFTAFIVMSYQGVNANIMSLGGIAIAIGAMVDAAIVMIENAHRHLEQHQGEPTSSERWEIITRAASEVGPALFYSLLIITLSFIPVFALQGQEGRMFSPLAYTKTYSMAAAAGLSVTLIPVLMGYLIRGRIPKESSNPINRLLITIYRPSLARVLHSPGKTLVISTLLVLTVLFPIYGAGGLIEPLKWPLQLVRPVAPKLMGSGVDAIQSAQDSMTSGWQGVFKSLPKIATLGKGIGHEFMPELFEGDLMYMPTTLPGISIGKARELLQQTDRLIKSVPEVKQVFGKIGRADTATDPAPLTMIETLIQLKPKAQWRTGLTLDQLITELDQRVKIPGLTNAWIMPIKTRIDMLSTGIKTPVGVKIAGPDIHEIERIGRNVEQILVDMPATFSAYSERVAAGRYIEITPKRREAARLGLNIEDINLVVSAAVGGINIARTVEGRERYPINVRFPREQRDDPAKLSELPLVTPQGAQITLAQVAEIKVVDGPPVLKSENARLNGWVFVDIKNTDLGSYVASASKLVQEKIKLPVGYSISWSGQYEYLQRAHKRLQQVVPLTIAIIFILLYLIFKRGSEALIVMLSLPFALVGGVWLMWLLGFEMSVATMVGFIALAGVAAEFGVVMLVYLDRALEEKFDNRHKRVSDMELKEAIMLGAVMRVRPKAMTVAVIIAGLLPIMLSSGTGSEVMQRIAAPMVGGMITAPLLSLFVIPAIYYLWKRRELNIRIS